MNNNRHSLHSSDPWDMPRTTGPILAEATPPGFTDYVIGGAGAGGHSSIPILAEVQRLSPSNRLRAFIVDSVPEKALALAKRSQDLGLEAEAKPMSIETFLQRHQTDNAPVIAHLDRPASIAALLRSDRTVLLYLIVQLPWGELVAIRGVLRGHETSEREHGANLFASLEAVTVRAGSTAILGEEGHSNSKDREPLFRDFFGKHLKDNLRRVLAPELPLAHPSFEASFDGKTSQPMVVWPSPEGFSEPTELARAIFEAPKSPILPGKDLLIAEVGPETDGLRFLSARRRKRDGRLSVEGVTIPNEDDTDFSHARRQQVHKRLEDIAKRRIVHRRTPTLTTD